MAGLREWVKTLFEDPQEAQEAHVDHMDNNLAGLREMLLRLESFMASLKMKAEDLQEIITERGQAKRRLEDRLCELDDQLDELSRCSLEDDIFEVEDELAGFINEKRQLITGIRSKRKVCSDIRIAIVQIETAGENVIEDESALRDMLEGISIASAVRSKSYEEVRHDHADYDEDRRQALRSRLRGKDASGERNRDILKPEESHAAHSGGAKGNTRQANPQS